MAILRKHLQEICCDKFIFEYPSDCKILNIFTVEQLEKPITQINVKEVSAKVVLLPYRNKQVFPMSLIKNHVNTAHPYNI